jgi:hypothetical protein
MIVLLMMLISAGIGEYLCWHDAKGGLIEFYGDVKAGRANGLGLGKKR